MLNLPELTMILQNGIFNKNRDKREKIQKNLVMTLTELKQIKKTMKKSKIKVFESWYLKTTLSELNKTIDLFEIYVNRGKRLKL